MLSSDHGNTLKKQSVFTNIGIIQLYSSTFFFAIMGIRLCIYHAASRALYVLSELGEIRQHIYNLT